MHPYRRAGRFLLVAVAGLAPAAMLTGPVAAATPGHTAAPGHDAAPRRAAATCPGWTAVRPPNPGTSTDDLFGVAVLSPSNAWAVGDDSSGGAFHTLIEHWNGTAWTAVPSPNPGKGSNYLSSVSAVSATSIWAVGSYASQTGGIAPNKTFILRWDGTSWTQVPSPSPGSSLDQLNGVRAASATSAWAVGDYAGSNFKDKTLILRWNGTGWQQQPSPGPGTQSSVLTGVDATGSTNAWAVGNFDNGHGSQSLVVRWNGTAWKQVPSPNPHGSSELEGVSATSATNAWAVGDDAKGRSVTLRWNGSTWTQVPSPNVLPAGDDNILYGVAATSASNAWAVGAATTISTGPAFELHWNGSKWTNMVSPNPGDTSKMFAVAASSASNAWAVGEFTPDPSGTENRTLAFHC